MKTISEYQWKRYRALGVSHVGVDGQRYVLEFVPDKGTCLTLVTVTSDGYPVSK